MGQSWYVLHSKPRKENQVAAYLRSQQIETFYPTLKVDPVNPRASRIRPYFPRYMFVHVDLDVTGISAVQWVPGAIGIVQFDGCASPVPDAVIYELKRQVAEHNERQASILDNMRPGDHIRITDGPLAGYEAIFDTRLSGTQRVQVLLEMLGRQIRAQVDGKMIEPLPTNRNPRH